MRRDVELRWRLVFALGLNALAIGVLVGLLAFPELRQRLLNPNVEIVSGNALVGGPFDLITQNGERVTQADFVGRPMLVAFGYSSDGNLTPALLQAMADVLDRLGPRAQLVSALFITLDPINDTSAKLKGFLANFHPRLLGLTGTPQAIAAVAKAYRLPIADSVDLPAPAKSTLIFEPLIYLMNREGRYVTHLTHAMTAEVMLAAIKQVL